MKTLIILAACFTVGFLASSANSQTKQPAGQWEIQKSGCEDDLKAVYFADDKLGWVVGAANTILKTTDGGKNWRRVLEHSKKGPTFDFVLFSNPRVGWVRTHILGTILHTTDGGETWTPVPLPNPQAAGKAFCKHAAVGSTYYLQHSAVLYRTDDAGKTWQLLTKDLPTDSQSTGELSFTDANHGCMVWGGGRFVTTEDGGKTWQTGQVKDASGGYTRTQFIDAKTGWLLPTYGKIHVTTDSGKNWQPQELGHPASNPLTGMQFVDAKIGHVLTGAISSEAVVRRTSDGGKTWQPLFKVTDAPSYITGLSFPTANHGWVIGNRGFIGHFAAE